VRKHAFPLSRIPYFARITFFLFMAVSASTEGADVALPRLPSSLLVPGGVAIVPTAGNAVRAEYRGERALLARVEGQQYAVIGIPLSAKPGLQTFTLSDESGKAETLGFSIADKAYTEQRLTIKNQRQVNPNQEDMVRIQDESAEMKQAFQSWDEELVPTFSMIPPVDGIRSSSFGHKRFFNGEPRAPHSGMDIAADEGTPIVAPASGRIVATGNYFFNGNTIILDHGHGLISLYCHMNTIDVEVGQYVIAGEQIGKVGQTGRVTGPHLHWSVNLNNTRIDPAFFLSH
jgi:murein DD-endopeptidase MepM/ murein hydrolase activator NlpD